MRAVFTVTLHFRHKSEKEKGERENEIEGRIATSLSPLLPYSFSLFRSCDGDVAWKRESSVPSLFVHHVEQRLPSLEAPQVFREEIDRRIPVVAAEA